MEINGKEYNLFYGIGAHVAFDNWAVTHPKASFTEGVLMKFRMMVINYNDAHHITDNEPPTKEELSTLPNSMYEEIMNAVMECEKRDTERKVVAEPKKGKNAKSTAR